jgi:hypothetical protein
MAQGFGTDLTRLATVQLNDMQGQPAGLDTGEGTVLGWRSVSDTAAPITKPYLAVRTPYCCTVTAL